MTMIPVGMADMGFPYFDDPNARTFSVSDSYTPTKNGYLVGPIGTTASQSSSTRVYINGILVATAFLSGYSIYCPVCIPVKSGDVITTYSMGDYSSLKFVSMKY